MVSGIGVDQDGLLAGVFVVLLVVVFLVGWVWVVEVMDSSSVSERTWVVDGCPSVLPRCPLHTRGGGLKEINHRGRQVFLAC